MDAHPSCPSCRGQRRGKCPFGPMGFSNKVDQGIFLSAFLSSNHHKTFAFVEGYPTVLIYLQVLSNSILLT